MPPIYPDVNGVRTSYCSIIFGVENVPLIGLNSINYRAVGEIPKVRGTASRPIGRPRGTVDYEGDIEILQSEWKNILLPQITRGGVFGYMELAFPITVKYAELASPVDIYTDTLIGVRFHSPDRSYSQSADALAIKVSLSIMDIIEAGKYRALTPL